MYSSRLLRWFSALAILICMCCSLTAVAQSGASEVSGVVQDQSGAAIPGAKVTLTNVDTGISRTVTVAADGAYHFSPVQPGRYKIKAEQTGFRVVEIGNLVANIDAHLQQNISLPVGQASESVEVVGTVPAIDTTKTEVAGVVTQQQIETLPVNTRQYLNLALLMPGTTQDGSRTFYNNVQVGSGGRFYANGFTVDGVTNTWAEQGEPRQNFPEGAVQEFKVYTTQYKAENGLAMGGLVTVVTKSGTNAFHGEAFEYFRDAALNRDNRFQRQAEITQGTGKAPFRRNQFGGDIGGPIIKNRMFFYGAYERTQTSDSFTIFTGLPQYYGKNEGTFNKPIHDQMISGRVDYQLTKNQNLFARYAQEWNLQTWQGCGGAIKRNCYDGQIPRDSIVVGETWAASNSLVNDFRFQYAYSSYQLGPSGSPIYTAIGTFPQSRLALLQTTYGFPGFSYGMGYGELGIETRWEFNDSVSIQKGHHSLKFGFDTSYIPFADDTVIGINGNWTFKNNYYFDPKDPASIAALGNAVPTLFTASIPPAYTSVPVHQYGIFAQDDWAIRPGLTLNLGLRYDLEKGSFDESLNPATQFATPIPYIGNPGKRGDPDNIGPRVGLAWDIFGNGRDVVRAGYGIYYNNIQTLLNFPEYRNLSQCSISINNPSYPDPFQGKSPTSFCSTAPPNVTILAPNFQNPYSQQFNVGYSRQVTNTVSIHVDGVYTHSLRDWRTYDLNYPDPVTGIRPLPAWGQINQHQTIGRAKYKALYVRAEKRAGRYQFLVSYTLQSNMDDNPQASVENYSNYMQDWGPNNIERRHNLVASTSVRLPAQITLGAIWTLRSSLPFSAYSSLRNKDGSAQYVPGTTRNQGNRDLSIAAVNAYRAGLGLAPIASIDSSRFNSVDIRASRAFFVKGERRIEAIGQVFNLFGTENLSGSNVSIANSSTFGKINGASNLQQAELAVRFVF